jgi:molybdate transport system substrate-binding protein
MAPGWMTRWLAETNIPTNAARFKPVPIPGLCIVAKSIRYPLVTEERAVKNKKRSFLAVFVVGLILCSCVRLRAQSELTLLSPNPITEPLDKLVANFEAKTGIKVKVTYGTGVSTKTAVANGQALDVTLLFAPFPEALKTGNIVPGSATVVARLRLALGVQKGAPKPDISNAAAVKRALLGAKSIAAIDPEQGSAGGIALAALDKLGITEQVKPKLKLFRGAAQVQDSVAKGETEIALGPYLSEMRNPGLDVVGPLPADASTPVDITGFLSTSLKDEKAAHTLLDYLRGPEAAPIWSAAKVFPAQ